MPNNRPGKVRNIAEVSTAIASGNLSKKVTVNVSGEILLLKETINTMVDQLNAFAGEVTRVRSEEHTSELQSQSNLVCRLLLEKKKKTSENTYTLTHSVLHSPRNSYTLL